MKHFFTKISLFLFALLAVNNFAQAQCQGGETQVSVSVTTDNYGSETSWKITGLGGTPVYGQSTTYGNNQTYNANVCVPDGPVIVFTIYDSYGDGICCQYGQGSYTVTANGNTIVTGGEFNTEEQTFFQTSVPVANDLAVTAITMSPIIAQGNTNITGTVYNFGTNAVSSFTLNYSIDNGATVSATVNTNINSGSSYNFTHSTQWNATPGQHTVKVWTSEPNSVTDANPLNDEMTTEVNVATQSVPSLPLFEEFTSSTCSPCASFNSQFDPFLESINTNQIGGTVAAIKYQMNWPNPGNDPSYNPDGNTRRTYYGVSGIPDLYLNGVSNNGSSSSVNAAASKPSFVNIELSYTLNFGNDVVVTAVVTPYANISGNIKLFIAVTENYYSYPGSTTSQDEFHFVMRKMLPNANGNTLSNLTAGTPVTVTKNYAFTEGGPAQGNYNLWGSINGITVVAFVQNMTTKEIYQAAIATSPTSIGINEEAASIGLQVFPNPFNNFTNVFYKVDGMENASVRIFDITGQQVYAENLGMQTSGTHNFQINAGNFASGLYVMNLSVGNKTVSHKLSITK